MPQYNVKIKPITISSSKKKKKREKKIKLKKTPKPGKTALSGYCSTLKQHLRNFSSLILVFFAKKSKIVARKVCKMHVQVLI